MSISDIAVREENVALLVEQIWRQLDCDISYVRVSQVVDEIVATYQDATIKSFIPIFVQRFAIERLGQEIRDRNLR